LISPLYDLAMSERAKFWLVVIGGIIVPLVIIAVVVIR
jgi:hypothetical protein